MSTKTYSAHFTINGQSGNQAFNNSEPITLQANDMTATNYAWSVTAVPADAAYQLEAENNAEAQLTLLDPGSFVVQLILEKDACQACARQLIWLVTPQRLYRLPANGEPLRFDGDAEWHGDLIKVIKDVDATLPLSEQKEALDAANAPATENPFATMADLPDIPIIPEPRLTPEQETAVDHANNPNGENPFATMADLPDIPIIPEPQLTLEQEAAVDHANNPNGENPFATMADLPDIPVIPEPRLTPEQEEAIDFADNPNAENPFITQSALPVIPDPQLTPEQETAVDHANNPNAENPFTTMADLPNIPVIPEPQLTPEQETAVDHANNPNGENPFATLADLPVIPIIPEPQLTPEQETAVDHANNPNAENPFATMSDLPDPELTAQQKAAIESADNPSESNPFVTQTEITPFTRLIPRAAGCLALHSDVNRTVTLGNLRITEIDTLNGRFTLTFDSYQKSRSPHYIVNALTVHDHPTTLNRIYNVEMVRFEQDGITFHMSRFPGGKAALAPNCMVEVHEII